MTDNPNNITPMNEIINATKRTDIYQIDPRNVDVVAGFNVRREFAIDELKEQIKLNGVLNPITVIPTKAADGSERYRLVDGERRLRATLAAIEEGADIARIKAIFLPRNTSEEEQLVQQMMRNEGKNFTEYECAIMFNRFKAFGYTQTEIAAKFGKSPTFVSRCLSLMELAPEIQQSLERGEISTNAVREIVGQNKENEAAQVEAVNAAVTQAKTAGKRTADNNDVPAHVKLLKAVKKASLAFKQAMALRDELEGDEAVLEVVCCRASIEAVAAQTDVVLEMVEGFNKAMQDGNK